MEKLYLHIRPNRRSGNRIEVKSKPKELKQEDQNGFVGFVGSYQEEETPSFVDKLDDQEVFELEWFNQCLEFNRKNLGKTAVEIEKVRLFLAPEFFNALVQLCKAARERGIPYSPMESMLNSLLEKAKAVERNINKQDGKPINILESIGIDIARGNEEFQKQRKFEDGRVIFAELVNIPGYYNQFIALAKERLGKNKVNAMPKHFLGYSKGFAIPSRWYYSIALEILANHGIDVFNLGLDSETIISLWLKPLIVVAGYKKDDAAEIFIKIFKPSDNIIKHFKSVFGYA